MSVTVDQEVVAAESLGLRTVGQVLSHAQRENRLVVNFLIDGEAPDVSRLTVLRAAPIEGHTLFIETVEPREIALEVLAGVDAQLEEVDRLRTDAVQCLHRNQPAGAMEKLSGCFTTWQNAQESVCKTAQLMRIDLESVMVEQESLGDLLTGFASQLRTIKSALEDRDFVTLADVLAYEMTHTTEQWQHAVEAVRKIVAPAIMTASANT